MSEGESKDEFVEIPDDEHDTTSFSWRKLWAFSGPGILMSIAFLDPGNIESDLQSGARAGYSLLWVLFWCTFVGNILQILAARLGVVTGKNMAEVACQRLPRPASLVLWLFAELAIITSDIQEVLGSAIALNILFGLNLWVGCLVTAADTFTFLFIHYYGVRKLELLFALLVATMAISFAVCFGISKPDLGQLLFGLAVPVVTSQTAVQAVATIGCIIMPHNLYLHSALVQSRAINRKNKAAVEEANFYNAIESSISLFISFMINLLVVSVFASGFYQQPNANVAGLSLAGDLLADRFGGSVRYIWAIGVLASGQSSTMTGTLAGQHVMQGYFNITIVPWMRVIVTRSIAIVPALIVALTYSSKMDFLNEYLNVAQSVQLPFALLPLILFSSDESVMGDFVIGQKMKYSLWTLFFVVLGINTYLFQSLAAEHLPSNAGMVVFYVLLASFYFGFMTFIAYNQLWHSRSISPSESGGSNSPSVELLDLSNRSESLGDQPYDVVPESPVET